MLLSLEVDRRGLPLLPAFELVTDFLIFVERAQSGSFHGRDVDEYVFRAVIGLNEAIALLGVEPLYCSVRHGWFLQTQNAAIQHWVAGQSRHGTESRSGALRAEERRRTTENRLWRYTLPWPFLQDFWALGHF